MSFAAEDDSLSHGPVVVGYKRSGRADKTLRWGAMQAAASQVPLRVVQAFEMRPGGDTAGAYLRAHQAASTRARLQLSAAKRRLEADFPDLVVETVAAAGSPARVLERFSRDASVLVLATRRQPQRFRWLGNSVTDRLTGKVRCPVLSLPAAFPVSQRPAARRGSFRTTQLTAGKATYVHKGSIWLRCWA